MRDAPMQLAVTDLFKAKWTADIHRDRAALERTRDLMDTGFRPALRNVADSLRRHPNSSIRVVGHTDNVGSAMLNNQLSQDRALAVARVLIENGINGNRIVVAGRGFYEPIASNNTAAGRAENRRVEIVITPTN